MEFILFNEVYPECEKMFSFVPENGQNFPVNLIHVRKRKYIISKENDPEIPYYKNKSFNQSKK